MTNIDQIIEYERCYLGSLFINVGQGKIETRLQTDDFFIPENGQIFNVIFKQLSQGLTPDLITVKNTLPNIATSTISELTSIVPSGANINFYENEIYEASKKRLFQKALKIANEQADNYTDIDTVIRNLLPALSTVTAAQNETKINTADALLSMQFPEIRWIIPGLIGEGLTMINGAPKIGKSWLVLSLAMATATGGGFLGSLKAQKTDTLYLALEDTERRLKSRIKVLNDNEMIKLDNLKITTQWWDGYIGLENYLKVNSGIGLVVIDTLARFANIEDMNDYSLTTNAMARIKRIADDLKIAIVVIHHTKKIGNTEPHDWTEAALGSTGLTGAVDGTIYINRPNREKPEATLYATSRDTADIKYNLSFDLNCHGWTINKKTLKRPGQDNESWDI